MRSIHVPWGGISSILMIEVYQHMPPFIQTFLPSFCDRTTPTPLVDQSTSKVKGLVKFGLTKIGVFTNASFKTLNAF